MPLAQDSSPNIHQAPEYLQQHNWLLVINHTENNMLSVIITCMSYAIVTHIFFIQSIHLCQCCVCIFLLHFGTKGQTLKMIMERNLHIFHLFYYYKTYS